MKTSLRLLCGVLLTAFALSGCAEQILDSASKDPAPSVTSGEENLSVTLAEFSTDFGQVPQPNALVFATVNSALEEAGEDILSGVSRNMPIRIPFSGPLADLYYDNGTWNSVNGQKLAQNMLIFPSDNGSAVVLPWPTHDMTGNLIAGGTFKAVYQDSNDELVLVPGSSTLSDNKTYVVAIKKTLGDKNGDDIEADALGLILMSPNPIVENGKIVNTLVREKYKNEADGGLETAESLEALRAAYNGGIINLPNYGLVDSGIINSHEDLAILYTFQTEESRSNLELTYIGGQQAKINSHIDNETTASQDDIVWNDATTLGAYAQGTNLEPTADNTSVVGTDLKATLEAIFAQAEADGETVPPLDNISKIYKGYFPCLNFLSDNGTDSTTGSTKWIYDFAKADSPGNDCPNSIEGMTGKIGFWIAKPAIANQVVIFQHGITSNKDTFFAIANSLAEVGMATVAIDIWGHGERAYEDGDADQILENKFDSEYQDSGLLFIRPDNPSVTAGYILQTQNDLNRFNTLLRSNGEIIAALGFTPSSDTVHFIGMSLGGIIGSNLAASGNFKVNKYVLNNPGGDVSDTVLNGYYGNPMRSAVAKSYGYNLNTKAGEFALNSTMLGVDLLFSQAAFGYNVDPLVTGSRTLPTSNILVQEMKGDTVVPNNNTELLAQVMGLNNLNDNESSQTDNATSPRTRWTFDPKNYLGTTEAGHSFLLDAETTATQQGQLQAVCFLFQGKIPNPSLAIDPTTCRNN